MRLNLKYKVLNILLFLLQVIYDLLKLFPAGSKITYISRQSNKPTLDIILLSEEISRRDSSIKQVMLMRRLEKGFFNKLRYCFHMLVQMYHIATSKTVVLDSYCIAISVLKHKKDLEVIQMWHAVGSLKKFAYSILNKPEGSSEKIAQLMKMHNNYNYVLASSEKSRQNFEEAFNLPEEKILVMGLPRIDVLTSENAISALKAKIYDAYGMLLNGKKNILYVPTFRKDGEIDYSGVIKSVDYNRYNLIIKPHNGGNRIFVGNGQKINEDKVFTGMEWLSVADYVITDYSAIVFEAALMGKPLYFYVYDLEKYEDDRGFYIDYRKEMPGIISGDIKVIIDGIEKDKYDKVRIKEFADKYIELKNGSCTANIADLIMEHCRKGGKDNSPSRL